MFYISSCIFILCHLAYTSGHYIIIIRITSNRGAGQAECPWLSCWSWHFRASGQTAVPAQTAPARAQAHLKQREKRIKSFFNIKKKGSNYKPASYERTPMLTSPLALNARLEPSSLEIASAFSYSSRACGAILASRSTVAISYTTCTLLGCTLNTRSSSVNESATLLDRANATAVHST